MASKSALVLVIEDSEEMETVISVDVLRRAGVSEYYRREQSEQLRYASDPLEQVVVTLAGVNGSGPVKCSRGVVIVPDISLAEVSGNVYDAIVLPGGKIYSFDINLI